MGCATLTQARHLKLSCILESSYMFLTMDIVPRSSPVPHNEITRRSLLFSVINLMRSTTPLRLAAVSLASARMSNPGAPPPVAEPDDTNCC
ncbi:Os06g0577350 [Oryza sativa Japonica Group]|uniref:Os06g0577350 protein n=1 Tax=Oryza sativa subsp. japonica TaxID=39947 RepID=A0A0P0WYJ5_ORYSJ|nr:Os06g0577350 [Oryza sativa Japonica Group]